jgi:hypothetical protein
MKSLIANVYECKREDRCVVNAPQNQRWIAGVGREAVFFISMFVAFVACNFALSLAAVALGALNIFLPLPRS